MRWCVRRVLCGQGRGRASKIFIFIRDTGGYHVALSRGIRKRTSGNGERARPNRDREPDECDECRDASSGAKDDTLANVVRLCFRMLDLFEKIFHSRQEFRTV